MLQQCYKTIKLSLHIKKSLDNKNKKLDTKCKRKSE